MPYTQKEHNEYLDRIHEESRTRKENIEKAESFDELMATVVPVMPTPREMQENFADYLYYQEEMVKLEAEFDKHAKQFVWGHVPEDQWPSKEKELGKRNSWMTQKINQKSFWFTDEINRYSKDERFINGASLAKHFELDQDFLDRAAGFLKDEKEKYERTSPVARFFSYLNPFKNKYRDARNKMERMEKEILEVVPSCKKIDLENYVNGKAEKALAVNASVFMQKDFDHFLEVASEDKLEKSPKEQFFFNASHHIDNPVSEKIFDDIEPSRENDLAVDNNPVSPSLADENEKVAE